MVEVTIDPSFDVTKSAVSKLKKAVASVKKAETKTRTELMPTVAKKTGDLRKGVNIALDEETIKLVAKKDEIKISLRKVKVDWPDYAKYHIHPGSKYGISYQNPNTPGTKPIDTRVWNRRLAKNIIAELPNQGFKVRV